MRAEPVHRGMLAVDVEGFNRKRRTDLDRLRLRAILYRLLDQGVANAEVDSDQVERIDCGDGVLLLFHPTVSKVRLLDPLIGRLAQRLAGHNRNAPAALQLRLRVAVHGGEVLHDRHGYIGEDLNLLFRLLEAGALRIALGNATSAPLALVVSETIFRHVVRHGYGRLCPETFTPAWITTKETTVHAWIHIPGEPQPLPATLGSLATDKSIWTPATETQQEAYVRRRRFVQLSARLASGLLAWQVLDADQMNRLLRVIERSARLDAATIDDAAAVAAVWHRLYWTIPAASLLPKVEGQLAIIEQLRAGARVDGDRNRVAVIEAGLSKLAGVINAQDRQDQAAARSYYTRALDAAADAAHHPECAHALGGMSFLEVYSGDPRVALRLAERAAFHANRSRIPSLGSWVALVRAHAHAGLGQSKDCLAALGQAKDLYAKSRRAEEPAWMEFLDERFVQSDEGACLVKLGRGRQALTVLDQALTGLAPSALKLRGVISWQTERADSGRPASLTRPVGWLARR